MRRVRAIARSAWRRQHGGILGGGKGARGVAEKDADHRAGEMFVRGGDDAVAPQVADGLRERADDALQQALRADFDGAGFERLLKALGVEATDGVEALVEQRGG